MNSTLMKKILGPLTLAALALAASGAQADWGRDGHDHSYRQSRAYSQQINARQDRQMERIQSGMHEGRLSRFEFRELMHEQREIRAMERHFRADDGIIDAREFQRLDRALDVASRNIRAEKHDRQARNAYGHAYRFN